MEQNMFINTEDIIKAAKNKRIVGEGAARILMMLLKVNKINSVYLENKDKQGVNFTSSMLNAFEINYELSDEDIDRIPKKGPCIVVSNHPFGSVDGMMLIDIIGKVRPDFKLAGSLFLDKAEPLKNHILKSPLLDIKTERENQEGVKLAAEHLQNGGCLAIFPAGEVSGYNYYANDITDKPWRSSLLKFIYKASVPIVPLYFRGANSKLFYLLEFIHPALRKYKFPSELLNKKNQLIKIKIGNPITVKDQKDFSDYSLFGRYLRAKTYALSTSLEVKPFFNKRSDRAPKAEPIVAPIAHDIVKKEVESLLVDYSLFKSSDFILVCAPSTKMPNLLNEIGRLREETFRKVGEGTNHSIDLDEYDLYYHHLFIWDTVNEKIVGAYRLGKGKEILDNYGMGGFYVQSLFRIDPKFSNVLGESIELGRSFIVEEYQRQPMPLFLLWKGILYFLLKNPEYRYLIGPVSISNKFSEFSKNAIIEHIKKYHYNEAFAAMIHPRCKFQVPSSTIDTEILLENTKDLAKLDRLIADVEVASERLPVLLKKYLKLNGKIIGFNVDPLFNNCLDGLLILDLFDVPVDTISALSKEFNDNSIMNRFYGYNENSECEKVAALN
jgi:putative hemolysin